MKAVIMDDIPLDYGPWLSFSPEGLDLLQGLLMRDPAQRLTAVQALEHPWFRRHFGAAPEDDSSSVPLERNNIVPLLPAAPRCSYYSSSAASVLGSMPV
jgi:serine/threonine protein kinase